jgi:Protein of unknown function
MSPELVDQAILAQCRTHFYKTARVIGKVADDLFVDDELKRKNLKKKDIQFIVDRIKALVKAEKLESVGDLDRWINSEIRLTGKSTAQAT